MIGKTLGPYRVLDKLGEGGMGEVWKARDPRLGRDVAIKVLPKDLAEDPDRVRRFEQEARAIAALNHPHICQIYDVGPGYLVLEYIDGAPLRGPLAPADAVRLALQIAERARRRPSDAASFTAISSRRTFWSPRTAARSYSTSAWRRS